MVAKTHQRIRPQSWVDLILPALWACFAKLDPRRMVKNPVMFVTEVGAIITTLEVFWARDHGESVGFVAQVSIWLWFTILFANFAEALAEGRGKAQADALRRSRITTFAFRILASGETEKVPAESLRNGDTVLVDAGQVIPSDGEVIEGAATVDESVITGESAPVIREAGGDRSGVTGGTTVLSDRIRVRVTHDPGESALDRIVLLVESARRQKTPNEIALHILLSTLTIIFLLVCICLRPFGRYIQAYTPNLSSSTFSVTVLIALLVCLIPTTIGGLLSAIGIAGINRMVQKNVLAMSGRAVEAAGDVHVLLLDKTGTITLGNRHAVAFHPAPGVAASRLAAAAQLSSLADETPEGRSIVALAERQGIPPRAKEDLSDATFVSFSAQTRMSGVDHGGTSIRKGATDAVQTHVASPLLPEVKAKVEEIARKGATPLAVSEGRDVLGVIELKDVLKEGLAARFGRFRAMGIRTIMVTGDNPLTAAAIAAEAGVDDFLAQATPADKLEFIRKEQLGGHLVAMTGDGTNDAPALAQADVGVAMNSGTQAAKEAGNMVDLDSNPTKLIEIVEIGKQLLMTRGALTTFSVSNDVAKYFAIIPAMLLGAFPQIAPLNVMGLGTPASAILSAVIFNALIIILLIPLALRGVKFRALGATAILRRNLLIYGLGGLIAPFVGIKLIDLVIHNLLHWV